MFPVERDHHNFTYQGYGDIGDLPGFRGEGAFSSNWRPTADEMELLLAGGTIELRIFTEPIPPVALNVSEPGPDDGISDGYEVVAIDGVEHKVPSAIAREMERLVEGAIKEITSFEPKPGTTIVITTASKMSADFTQMVMTQAADQFSEYRVSVMPESLGLHTQDGLAQLIAHGTSMAEAVRQLPPDEQVEVALAAADRWEQSLGARGEEPSS